MAGPEPPRRNYDGSWEVPGLPGTWPSREAAVAATGGGGGGGGGDYTPAGLAAVFRQPDVTLPRGEEAKGALRDLQLSGTRGFEALLAQDPQAGREALRRAIYDPAAEDINYQADRTRQRGLETMFGRNMGASSVTGDYVIEPTERARGVALARAGNDAFVQANTLANQNATTQAQLLGQAFNQGTAGLTAEAGVESANRAANQQATQAGYTTGIQREENATSRAQQESQFGRSLAQQKDLQESAFANARDIAGSSALASGIGGLSQFFAPAANNFLANQWPSLFGTTR